MKSEKVRVPLRTCFGCRKVTEKVNLIRIAQDIGGNPVVDHKGRLPGRGLYVCRNPECVRLFAKKRGLDGRKGQSSVFLSGLMYEIREAGER